MLVDGRAAGLWLTAGSNTVVSSDPAAEGGAAEPVAVTSGARRLLQDEFLLPPALTANKSAVELRFVIRPHAVSALWPGSPPLKRHGVWCESDVEVYCYR